MKEGIEIGKVPPQNLEAERSVLGSLLLDPSTLPKALEILQPEDFYWEAHQIIYKAILATEAKGQPIDLITVAEELRRNDQLEKIGGVEYLRLILDSVPTSAYLEHYARIVQEKAILRSLIQASQKITGMAYEEGEELDTLLDRAEALIFSVGQRRLRQHFVHLKPILEEEFERLDELYHKRKPTTGVPSGFQQLDYLTAGFQRSNLIVVAGRPGMGKTSFALTLAEHAAVREGVPVGIFSLEMSKSEVALRMLCSYARVNGNQVRKGIIGPDDWDRIINAIADLSNAPIYIDDTPDLTVLEMRAKARRLMSEVGLGLIVVDYLQLLKYEGRAENRNQEISAIARSLKALARELDVPVIALSQLSRRVEQREDKRPQLSDLRESGSIEAEADVVLFLYRESYYEQKDEEEEISEMQPDETELILAKQRNGPAGRKIKLLFLPAFARFEEAEIRFEEDIPYADV